MPQPSNPSPTPKKPRGAGGGRGDLTVELIINTTKRLALNTPFERLSIKDLAVALGVKSPAIYYHLPNKSSLLSLTAEQIMRDVKMPDPAMHWKEQLHTLVLTMRDTFMSYPGLGRYMLCHPTDTGNALWLQMHLKVLCDAGLSNEAAAEAMATLYCYVNPLNMLDNPYIDDVLLHRDKAFREYARQDPETFRELGRVLPLMPNVPYQTLYETGLPLVIDGIEKHFCIDT